MQQRHAQYTNMTYRVSDCRDMPEFMDCSFGHVLDKGVCVSFAGSRNDNQHRTAAEGAAVQLGQPGSAGQGCFAVDSGQGLGGLVARRPLHEPLSVCR